MPQVDISKLIPVLEESLMAQARLAKRDPMESDAKSFSRLYENDLAFRKSWATITEAKHRLALKAPNLMSTTPVTTEVGNTNVADDSAKAVAQLNALAEKQHRSFEEVFLDPQYRTLASRTYGGRASSPSYDELM